MHGLSRNLQHHLGWDNTEPSNHTSLLAPITLKGILGPLDFRCLVLTL